MKEKRSPNRVLTIIVRIIGYIFALGLSVLFALFMSAPTGWTFFYILTAALVFSFVVQLLTFISFKRGHIRAEMSFSSTLVSKNEELKLHIKLVNDSLLPISNIKIKLSEIYGAVSDSNEFSAAVNAKGSTTFDAVIKPSMWGVLRFGEAKILISDFMNITSFDIGPFPECEKVYVFPDIPEIRPDCPFIRSAADAMRFSDESEDTKEDDSCGLFGGMPGFTHREYTEGDPIKRINWKLSSKKDAYFVRLDDEIEAFRQTIVIDRGGLDRKLCERSVEGALGVCSALLKLGFESSVWFRTPNGFEPHNVSDESELYELRTALAHYEFSSPQKTPRLPVKELSDADNNGGIMLFTPYADTLLLSEISSASEYGLNFSAITHELPEGLSFDGTDFINDDFIE